MTENTQYRCEYFDAILETLTEYETVKWPVETFCVDVRDKKRKDRISGSIVVLGRLW